MAFMIYKSDYYFSVWFQFQMWAFDVQWGIWVNVWFMKKTSEVKYILWCEISDMKLEERDAIVKTDSISPGCIAPWIGTQISMYQ